MPQESDRQLHGQHIVITGGGSGLGEAMATRFAELGAAITINGRTKGSLDKTVAAIRERDGRAEGIVCNVRDAESVAEFVREAEDRQGPIHALVNNAAANFLARTEALSPNAFDAIVRTNLYGSFFCTQEVGRKWIERRAGGVVLSIVTTYAETGSAFVVPSAASKAAIVAMTKSLAVEWGRYGIRLNALAPGPFPTEGAWKRLVPDGSIERMMRARVPLSRFGDRSELADLAAFMVGSTSSYMNGAVVTLDGGEVLASGGQFNGLMQVPSEDLDRMFDAMRR